jgi:hypothetical protein
MPLPRGRYLWPVDGRRSRRPTSKRRHHAVAEFYDWSGCQRWMRHQP